MHLTVKKLKKTFKKNMISMVCSTRVKYDRILEYINDTTSSLTQLKEVSQSL